MKAIERLLKDADDRSHRIGAARVALEALLPDERREIAVDLVREIENLPAAGGQRMSVRAVVRRVLENGSALGTAEIFHAAKEFYPSAKRGSIAGEIMRMQKDRLLVRKGAGGRGARYALANGGAVSTPG